MSRYQESTIYMKKAHITCIAPDKRGIHIIFFSFLYENICCGYSLEVLQRSASNEYPQHVSCGEIRKLSFIFFG